MNLRHHCLSVVTFAVLATGCISEQETIREVPYIVDREVPVYVDRPVPAPAEDGWQGLEVLVGDLSDVAIMQGDDRETLRVDVANHGERNVVALQLPVGIAFANGEQVTDANAYTDVKFVDRANLYTLMGPLNLNPEVGANIYLNGDGLIRAGETTTFVLRMDIAAAAGRYQVTVGSLAALLEGVVYEDTLERVPADMIRNNQIIGRVFEVLAPPADMPVPSPDGPVALITSFGGGAGLLTPSSSPYYIGTATMVAYGGATNGGIVRFEGSNLGAFEELELVEGADVVASATVAGGVQADFGFESVRFEEGELRSFELRGRLRPADDLGPFYAREIEVRLSHVSFVPDDGVAGEGFIRTFSDPALRVFRAFPIVTSQTLSSTTLANGSNQELYKFLLTTNPWGSSISLGGMTFGLSTDGFTRPSLSQFRLRRGSTELPRDSYRVVDMSNTTNIEGGALVWNHYGSTTVAILFDPAALEVGAAGGDTFTLTADVAEVASGQVLYVSFGPRAFSGEQGVLDADGYLHWSDGVDASRSQDALYWSDDPAPEYYFTGSWMIGGLDTVVTLSR